MAVTKDQVFAALAKVASPDGTPLSETNALSEVVVTDGKVFFSISVDAGVVKGWEPVRQRAEETVRALPGVSSVMVALTAERKAGAAKAPAVRRPERPPPRTAPRGDVASGVPGVEAIIAVASARAASASPRLRSTSRSGSARWSQGRHPGRRHLRALAAKTSRHQGAAADARRHPLKPITRYGLTVMSIGFLIDEETPMNLARPDVISALTQMLREVEWGTLDVMVVDMPPGTGDAQLTMAQQVPLKGAVIVSTAAGPGADRRAARDRMFRRSTCRCSHCRGT